MKLKTKQKIGKILKILAQTRTIHSWKMDWQIIQWRNRNQSKPTHSIPGRTKTLSGRKNGVIKFFFFLFFISDKPNKSILKFEKMKNSLFHASMTITMILQKYLMRLKPNFVPQYQQGITLQSKGGMPMTVEKRNIWVFLFT